MNHFQSGHDRIVIAHSGDGYHAFVDECTHEAVPLSEGYLRNGEFICHAHGAKFDAVSGEVTAPPAVVPIEKLELRLDGQDIMILLDD